MVWTLEPKADRHLTRNKVNQSTRNKEWGHTTWTTFMKQNRRFRDGIQTTNTRSDHDACAQAAFFVFGFPIRILNGHFRRRNSIQNEIINFATLFGLHPIIRIERAVRSIAQGHFAGIFCRNALCIKTGDIPGP